jgi:hypothetical protein
MFTELIDIFTLFGTLPNRGVLLTEAAFVIVTSLFALELIVLLGLILKTSALIVLQASALPHARLIAGRALPRPPGARRAARAGIAAAATPVWPAAGEANRVFPKSSDRGKSPSAPPSIEGLARAIDEAHSWRDPADRP